jgi:hypothetical protein
MEGRVAKAREDAPFIPTTVSELTPEYLTRVLRDAGALGPGSVRVCKAELIGEGYGFACDVARLHLSYADGGEAGPATLIAKLPTTLSVNRAGIEALGGYEREVCFLQELAGQSLLRLPRCYAAEMDPDPYYESRPAIQRFVERFPVWAFRILVVLGMLFTRVSKRRYLILLEDLAPAKNGDQVAGCTMPETLQAVRGLAAFHASYWGDETLGDKIWLPRPNTMVRALMAVHRRSRRKFFRLHPEVPAHMEEACQFVDAHCEQIMERLSSQPSTVLHGDYRLDNLFFAGDEILASDFQLVSRGRAGFDLAYFVAGSVGSDVDHDMLIDAYCEALAAHGVEEYSRAECARDYTLSLLAQAYLHTATEDGSLEIGGERGTRLLDAMRQRLYARIPRPPYDHLL